MYRVLLVPEHKTRIFVLGRNEIIVWKKEKQTPVGAFDIRSCMFQAFLLKIVEFK